MRTRSPIGGLGQKTAHIVAVAEHYLAALHTHDPDDMDHAADLLWRTVHNVEGIQRMAVMIDLALLAAKLGADDE